MGHLTNFMSYSGVGIFGGTSDWMKLFLTGANQDGRQPQSWKFQMTISLDWVTDQLHNWFQVSIVSSERTTSPTGLYTETLVRWIGINLRNHSLTHSINGICHFVCFGYFRKVLKAHQSGLEWTKAFAFMHWLLCIILLTYSIYASRVDIVEQGDHGKYVEREPIRGSGMEPPVRWGPGAEPWWGSGE